jgi:peptidyl-prolyl cis-trans isomerase SurA
MRLITGLISTLLLLMLCTQPILAELVDRVVAIVNDDVITLSEVNEAGKAIFQRVAEQEPADQLNDTLQKARESVLNSLIDRKILVQEAKKRNITVEDVDVDLALQRILERNATTMEQFREELAAMAMPLDQFRQNLRDQILSSRLVNYEVHSKVIIPEERIIDYYDMHYTEHVGEGGFYILQIGINFDKKNGKTDEETRQKAKRIHSLAASGQDFRELARQYSDLPSAADGGDLGVFQANEMASYMREPLLQLRPGEISQIVETPSGLQFFKLLSSQEGEIVTKAPYESVKEEIRQILYKQEMEERYDDWMKKMRDQAYVKIF